MLQFAIRWILILACILGITSLLATIISRKNSKQLSKGIFETYLIAVGTFSLIMGLFWMLIMLVLGGAEKIFGDVFMIIALSINVMLGLVYAMNERTLPTTYQPYQMQIVGVLLGSTNISMFLSPMTLRMAMDDLSDDIKIIGLMVCLSVGGLAGMFTGAIFIRKKKWLQFAIDLASKLNKNKGANEIENNITTPSILDSFFFKGWLIGTTLATIAGFSTTFVISNALISGFSSSLILFAMVITGVLGLFVIPFLGMLGGILLGIPLGFTVFQGMIWLQRILAEPGTKKEQTRAINKSFFNAQKAKGVIISGLSMIIIIFGMFWISEFISERRMQGQLSELQWQFTYGSGGAQAIDLYTTLDGAYIATGFTASKKGIDSDDAWIVKLDSNGQQLWEHVFDHKRFDLPSAVRPALDGGYLVIGKSSFANGVKHEAWIRKLDEQGQFLWERLFKESIRMIHPIPDGCIVAGYTSSKNAPSASSWLLNLNTQGGKVWTRSLSHVAYNIYPGSDGGYIAIGYKHYTETDGWVAKFDAHGQLLWEHTYDSQDVDILDVFSLASDHGYIVAGRTESQNNSNFDVWILKLDEQGDVVWEQTFGTNGWDQAQAITPSPDGGYLVAASKGGGRAGDAWLLKLDDQGQLLWERTFGSMLSDYTFYAVQPAFDGGYVVAGNKGGKAWIFKLKPNIGKTEIQGTATTTK